jgi:transcriptional regulator with XRE-family HTH domain
MKSYPNSLRSHRKNAGLLQRDVARALGLNGSERISKWENGYSAPREKTLFRLAGLYHVPPQQLFREVYGTMALEHTPEPSAMVRSRDLDGKGPFWKKGPPYPPISELSASPAGSPDAHTREEARTPRP